MKKSREAPAKKKIQAKAGKDFFKDTDIVKSVKGAKEIKILPLHKIAEIVFGNDPKKNN